MQRLSVNPLLTPACLACCKDQSQTPRATGSTRKGPQVPLSPSAFDAASPSGVLSGCSSASLVPLPPGLLRTARSPHCPSLGVFPLESILGQSPYFLALQRVRGSTLLPRLSNQNLCWVLVSPWGFSIPFQEKSQSLHVLDQLPEDTVLWEGGRRAGPCSRGPGVGRSGLRLLSAALCLTGPGVLPCVAPRPISSVP